MTGRVRTRVRLAEAEALAVLIQHILIVGTVRGGVRAILQRLASEGAAARQQRRALGVHAALGRRPLARQVVVVLGDVGGGVGLLPGAGAAAVGGVGAAPVPDVAVLREADLAGRVVR